ncbi:MAG: lysophospholipase [Candidatus Asgardarchaeia archaeon]
MEKLIESWFSGYDNTKLYYRGIHVNNPKGVVIVVHGLAEHSGRYIHLFEALYEANYSVYAFDLRGHGKSEGIRGHIKSFDEYILDLEKFIELIREKENVDKVFILGHSLGGLIVLRFAIKKPDFLKGVISSAAALRTTVPVSRITLAIGKVFSKLLPTAKFSNNIDPSLLTHDKSVVNDYVKDPLVFRKVSARLAMEIFDVAERTLRDAYMLVVPCLLLAGTADKIVDPMAIKEFYENVKAEEKELKLYDGMYHEILNEIGKETVIKDIINWLDKHSEST